MKHSIRLKITMIFVGLMAAVLVSLWAVNSFFLESFYTRQKLELLEDSYERLNNIIIEGRFEGNNLTEDLQSLFSSGGEQTEASRLLRLMSDKYNTTIVIQDSITGGMIPLAKDGKFLAETLRRYILGINDPRTETFVDQDNHKIQKIYDWRSQGYYLQSWGFFDDNRTMFIMSMPIASISDSVRISNEFLAYVGLAALIIGSGMVYYATKKVVSPIRSLASLSSRMSELDFEARYTGNFEDEIGTLGRSMNILSEKLKDTIEELKTANQKLQKDIEEKIKIDETRKEFIANVSHELKTPIALIQGYAEGLTEGMAEDEESRNYYCEVIEDEAEKMNKMVKQLLALTALEFGNDTAVMEPFDMTALIQGILSSVRILLEQKEVQVEFDQAQPVWVYADEFKIEEVITNYLNNAMNHAEGEKKIRICLEYQGEDVKVTVYNTGKHIPEEDLEYLWGKFYKVDKARTRAYGGSGIGLSIVKAIMESHHQGYGVANAEGGVEFWFTVARGAAPEGNE